MGLFNNDRKIQDKQFRAQLEAQRDANEVGTVQQLDEQGRVSYDPQVSALILECKRRFLPWVPDYENQTICLPKKYEGLKEPINPDDIMSFLEDEEKKIVWEGYELLDEYFTIGEKYGFAPNVVRAFNKVVNSIEHVAHVSRMTGKNVKVSKSQYVEGSSNITRFNNPKQKGEKLFGIFG